MGFLIGLFTVVMVLDCAALILLVLIQLPKKDADIRKESILFFAGNHNHRQMPIKRG